MKMCKESYSDTLFYVLKCIVFFFQKVWHKGIIHLVNLMPPESRILKDKGFYI